MTSFMFTPFCGCSGTPIPGCNLLWESYPYWKTVSDAEYGFNWVMRTNRNAVGNNTSFHHGFKIINGNEAVPITTEENNIPFGNLLIFFDSYRNGGFVQREFYTDETQTFGAWVTPKVQGEYSNPRNQYWMVSNGASSTTDLATVGFNPELNEYDLVRIFALEWNYTDYPLNFQYEEETARSYRNAPHIFLPEVDSPIEYYIPCSYSHLPNCGEGTHIGYRTGTDENPFIRSGELPVFWDGHRDNMRWGTSREFIGQYGITGTPYTYINEPPFIRTPPQYPNDYEHTPLVDSEMWERTGKCKHIDGIADETECRWNHDILESMAQNYRRPLAELGHFVFVPYSGSVSRVRTHDKYKNGSNRTIRTRIIGEGDEYQIPTRYYPGDYDDPNPRFPWDGNGGISYSLWGRCYVWARSQLCSPFHSSFHHYCGFMYPLGRYEILPNNDPSTVDYHGNNYYLYTLKLRKRVHDFTHTDFTDIKLNMPGTENYYDELLSTAPFIHTNWINGFSVVAYPAVNLMTDPNDVTDYTKTQGHIIGAASSTMGMTYSQNQEFGYSNKFSDNTHSAINIPPSFWLMNCQIAVGAFISAYDQGYYSSFDHTNYDFTGPVMLAHGFRDFTLADGKTKVKIPDIPDGIYDKILPGDGYIATSSKISFSGTLYYYPMVYMSGYTIEELPEEEEEENG